MSTLFETLAEAVLKGAVKKATDGFVAKGYITAEQQAVMDVGIMDELQVAMAMYEAGQQHASTGGLPPVS